MVLQEYFTRDHIDTDIISDEVRISSISSHIRLGTTIRLPDVFRVLKESLHPDEIGCVTYGSEECKVIQKKKRRKPRKQFQNSIAVDIVVTQTEGMKFAGRTSRVNMKLFSNGTIQMSGCRCRYDGNTALNILIGTLSKRYMIVDGVTKEIRVVDLVDGPIEPHGLQINMINTDLKLSETINREKLYSILLEQKIQCKYDKINHAPVDLNYIIEDKPKPIHIYFFESGSVIITGSKNHHQINGALEFMHDTIDPIQSQIKKIDADAVSKLALSSKFAHLIGKSTATTATAYDDQEDVSLWAS